MTKAHILFCDDDTRLTQLLPQLLHQHGFYASAVNDVAQARQVLQWYSIDLLILDVMMQHEDGLSFLSQLRQSNNTVPVLMLSALASSADRIRGLAQGADDYLVKPFDPQELILRIEALLRRSAPKAPPPANDAAEFIYDAARSLLHHKAQQKTIVLTTNESTLLQALLQGDVVSREVLGTALGVTDSDSRAVDIQITRLRKKIGDDAQIPRYIVTVRGRGYRLAATIALKDL